MKSPDGTKTKEPSRWGYRLVLILAGVILGINIYNWNANKLAGNAMPMPMGTGIAVVMSGSMEPELSVNDLVVIRESSEYKKGDVVVYQSGRMLVIHRIEEVDGEMVTTKGDANNATDEPIPYTSIKGKLWFAIPVIGGVIQTMKTVPATIIMLVAAFLLMELSWQKEKEQDDETLDDIKAEIRKLKDDLKQKKGD